VEAKKAAKRDRSICPPGMNKGEADARVNELIGSLEDQMPLANIKDVKDEASMRRLLEHMKQEHETTLIRLKEKRMREGKD